MATDDGFGIGMGWDGVEFFFSSLFFFFLRTDDEGMGRNREG